MFSRVFQDAAAAEESEYVYDRLLDTELMLTSVFPVNPRVGVLIREYTPLVSVPVIGHNYASIIVVFFWCCRDYFQRRWCELFMGGFVP